MIAGLVWRSWQFRHIFDTVYVSVADLSREIGEFEPISQTEAIINLFC
jgi:hypothetical protein